MEVHMSDYPIDTTVKPEVEAFFDALPERDGPSEESDSFADWQ